MVLTLPFTVVAVVVAVVVVAVVVVAVAVAVVVCGGGCSYCRLRWFAAVLLVFC